MKLNRLKSVVNEAIRFTITSKSGYLQDPFIMFSPEVEYEVDLIAGKITPNCEGDDVENYYKKIAAWFRDVLPKEGIPLDIIDKAIIEISPERKKCIIQAQGREFTAEYMFKKK